MPIYDFHCDKCENDSEILVRSSDWKGTKCPHCGSARLAKRLSVFASTTGSGSSEACCGGDGGACDGSGGGACGCCCGGGNHHH